MRLTLLLLMLFLVPFNGYAADAAPPRPITGNDLLAYLERVISWNHAVAAMDQLAVGTREAVLREKSRQNAEAVLQKSFDFARAQAAISEAVPVAADTSKEAANASKGNTAESRRTRMLKAVSEANQRVSGLQYQLSQPGVSDVQREKLTGALKLAQARQALLQNMLSIFSAEDEGSGTLLDQINALSEAVPNPSPNQPPAKDAASPQALPASPQGSGIFGLSDALLALSHKKSDIEALLKRTQKLSETTHALIASTRAGLNDALTQGNALSASSDDAVGLAAYRQSVEALVDRYKQLSAVIIPLGEISVQLRGAEQNLQEWDRIIDEMASRLSHQLLIRLGVLAVSIAIPLICSLLAHRAIYRYAKDVQQRKQLDMTRRILLIVILIVAVLANFITEFGSLATFAGFLTAGIAVALQSVLISLVAHSLYFGRYGIHIGDRVKVADVTGEVIQLGLLRLYIKELKETGSGLQPTGKIVAFPNSILFQPSAFYKYADDGAQ